MEYGNTLDYLNLNAQEVQTPQTDYFALEDNLALFSNNQFLDLGDNNNIDIHQLVAHESQPKIPSLMQGDSNFQNTYTEALDSPKSYDAVRPSKALSTYYPDPSSISVNLPTYNSLPSPLPATLPTYNSLPSPLPTTLPSYHVNSTPPMPTAQPIYNITSSPASQKLSLHVPSKALNNNSPSSREIHEPSRLAADEDKRRRNTAASARFRVKKKQREQTLEKNVKEMSEKVSRLESLIRKLETENKWLRDLVMEKNEKMEWTDAKRQEYLISQSQDGKNS